jgi:SAM-dependent methyltransferase
MSNLTNPDLIQFLACPDCGGELGKLISDHLKCLSCNAEYEVQNGIPRLYSKHMDFAHLREEEYLARIMKAPRPNAKERFSATQWDISKQEFWSTVRNTVPRLPKSFINIGCGFDERFRDIEQQGSTFVNFDMIHSTLVELQRSVSAKSCVAGDVNYLPFKKNMFDYVISIDVVHHENENLLKLLQSFRDLLKPGGTLFLEDPNAWGLFQMWKSIFLPRYLYGFMRSRYHKIKRSEHRPADYEFPTNVWRVMSMLRQLGFREIKVYPHNAYPCIGAASYRFYRLFSGLDFVRKYHNFHYMLSAARG